MKNKFLFIFLFLIMGCKNIKEASSSNKQIETKYIANDDYFAKFNSISKRVYKTENHFVDYGLLCSDDNSETCSLEFNIKNNNWYVWNGKKWKIFYNFNRKKIIPVKINSKSKTIAPLKSYYGKDTIYSFSCIVNNVNFTTDNNEFLFSPKKGIVIIKNEQTFYTRNDYDSSWIEDQIKVKH